MTSFQKDDLKQKLLGKHTVYGTCITTNAPRWPKIVAGANLDFVFIDTEHIAIDRDELSKMCNSYQALGLTPRVRIPKPDPYRAQQSENWLMEILARGKVFSPQRPGNMDKAPRRHARGRQAVFQPTT